MIPTIGYKFLRQGNRVPRSPATPLPASRLYDEWDQRVFFEVIREVETDEPGEEREGDLKIVTSLFHDVMDLRLHKLLLRGHHIKILMMDPENRSLIQARYSRHRKDFGRSPAERALRNLTRQIVQLTTQLPQAARDERPECTGTIEVRLSNIMPCGFLVLTRRRALLGAMLAHRSYIEGGPMTEISRDNSTLWELLNGDWQARWEDAKRVASNHTSEKAKQRSWRGARAGRSA